MSLDNKIFEIDRGKEFGMWTDPVSKFMYHDHFVHIYTKFNLDSYKSIEDIGGANGILRQFFEDKDYSTSDIDESKEPDFIGNIVNYNGIMAFKWRGETYNRHYQNELIVIRYVLHYLSDEEVIKMFSNIKENHKGDILVVQFTNEAGDLDIKLSNSINETKYFRTQEQLYALLQNFNIVLTDTQSFEVTAEFY